MPRAPSDLLVALDDLRLAGGPTVMTYEGAKDYGIDLSEWGIDNAADWQVKFSPDEATEGGLKLSYISPYDYEYIPGETEADLNIIDPAGQLYTYDEWNTYQAGLNAQYAEAPAVEEPTPISDLLSEVFITAPQNINWEAEDEAAMAMAKGQVSTATLQAAPSLPTNFASMNDEEAIATLRTWIEQDPQGLLEQIGSRGRTAASVALLQRLMPEATEDDIASVFGEIGPSGLTYVMSKESAWPERTVQVRQDNSVWLAPVGVSVEDFQASGNQWEGMTNIGTYDPKTDMIMPYPPALDTQAEKKDGRNVWQKLWGTWESWLGDAAAQIKGATSFMGAQGDINLGLGLVIANPFKTVLEPVEEFLVPEWQAQKLQGAGVQGQGVGWAVARAFGPAMMLAATSILTGGATGAAAISAGLGKATTFILSGIAGGMSSRIIESSIEAGQAQEQARLQGYSEDEALNIANNVFARNTRDLALSDVAQFMVGMTPIKLNPSSLVAKGLVTVGRVGAKTYITGVTEGFEEYYQEIIQRQAFGEDISTWALSNNLKDEDLRQIALVGAILGVGQGTVFDVVSQSRDAASQNLKGDALMSYQQAKGEALRLNATLQEAETSGLDAAAAAPGGGESIQQATASVKMRADLQTFTAPTETEARNLEERARQAVPETPGVSYANQVRVRESVSPEAQQAAEVTTEPSQAIPAGTQTPQVQAQIVQAVRQVPTLLDPVSPSRSVARVAALIEKSGLTEQQVEGIDALKAAVEKYRAISRKGQAVKKFKAQQAEAWKAVVEAANNLQVNEQAAPSVEAQPPGAEISPAVQAAPPSATAEAVAAQPEAGQQVATPPATTAEAPATRQGVPFQQAFPIGSRVQWIEPGTGFPGEGNMLTGTVIGYKANPIKGMEGEFAAEIREDITGRIEYATLADDLQRISSPEGGQGVHGVEPGVEAPSIIEAEQADWMLFMEGEGNPEEVLGVDAITNPSRALLLKLLGLTPDMVTAKIIEMRGYAPINKQNPIRVKELRAAMKELNQTQTAIAKAITERYEAEMAAQKESAKEAMVSLKEKFGRLLQEAAHKADVVRFKTERKAALTEQAAAGKLTTEQLKAESKANFIAEIKNDLRVYVQQHLPKAERGAMITAVDRIKNETELGQALGRVEAIAERYAQKVWRTKIARALEVSRITKMPPKWGGKFDAAAQTRLDKIRQNLKGDRDAALSEMISLAALYESGGISEDEVMERASDLNLQGIKGMTSEELEAAYADLLYLMKEGRANRQADIEAVRARQGDNLKEGLGTLTGGKGTKPVKGGVVPEAGRVEGLKALARMIFSGQLTWDYGMDALSKLDKTSKQGQSFLSKWAVNLVHKAWNKEYALKAAAFKEIREAQMEIFGVRKKGELNKLLSERYNKVVDLGTFTDGKGREVKLEMTKGQMIKKYMEMLDPTLAPRFENIEGEYSMAWTEEMKEAVTEGLTTQEKAWAHWQMEFYQRQYVAVNEVFKKMYGFNLPRNPFYSPVKVDYRGNETLEPKVEHPEHLKLLEESYRYATETNENLKRRTINSLALKNTDADEVLLHYVREMAHFVAWAEPIGDLRAFWGNDKVKQAIRDYHDPGMNKWIADNLNDFARGAMDSKHVIQEIETLRNNFTVAALSRLSVIVKQPSSLPSWITQIGIKDFAHYALDFGTDPAGHWKEMWNQSSYLQERYTEGFDRDVKLAWEQFGMKNLNSRVGVRNWLLQMVSYMDAASNAPGLWAVYQSAKARGLSDAEAIVEMELACERTQTTSRLSALTPWQRGGTFWRLFTMFQNNQVKYYNLVAQNIRNMRYGRADTAAATRNILIAWVILPCLFQWMTDGFRFKKEHQATTAILGPIGNMLVLSGFIDAVEHEIWTGRGEYQGVPLLQTPADIVKLVGELKGLIDDDSIAWDEVIKFVEDTLKVGGYLTGVPTPYLIQVGEAIRQRDWWQIAFTKYALYGEGKAPEDVRKQKETQNTKLSDAWDKLGEPKELPEGLPEGAPVPEPETYDMNDLRNTFYSVLKDVDPADTKGLSPIAQNYITMLQAQAQEESLPYMSLIDINADPFGGETYRDYMTAWSYMNTITDPKEMESFRKTWGTDFDKLCLGNITQRQADLLDQYHSLTDDTEREAFLEAHPELAANPRQDWLRSHTQENALLALWGKEELLTMDSYKAFNQLVETYDIPDSALVGLIPPEKIAETYFQYQDYKEQGMTGASPEVKLLRLQNPDFDAWGQMRYNWRPITDQQGVNAITIGLDIKYKEQDEVYSNLVGRYRLEYLVANPDYAASRYTRDAYDKGYPAKWVDEYVAYHVAIDLRGTDRRVWLSQHMDFYRTAVKVEGWIPLDFSARLPNVRNVTFKPPEPREQYTGYSGAKW